MLAIDIERDGDASPMALLPDHSVMIVETRVNHHPLLGAVGMPKYGHSPTVKMVTGQGQNYLANRALTQRPEPSEGHLPMSSALCATKPGEGEGEI